MNDFPAIREYTIKPFSEMACSIDVGRGVVCDQKWTFEQEILAYNNHLNNAPHLTVVGEINCWKTLDNCYTVRLGENYYAMTFDRYVAMAWSQYLRDGAGVDAGVLAALLFPDEDRIQYAKTLCNMHYNSPILQDPDKTEIYTDVEQAFNQDGRGLHPYLTKEERKETFDHAIAGHIVQTYDDDWRKHPVKGFYAGGNGVYTVRVSPNVLSLTFSFKEAHRRSFDLSQDKAIDRLSAFVCTDGDKLFYVVSQYRVFAGTTIVEPNRRKTFDTFDYFCKRVSGRAAGFDVNDRDI